MMIMSASSRAVFLRFMTPLHRFGSLSQQAREWGFDGAGNPTADRLPAAMTSSGGLLLSVRYLQRRDDVVKYGFVL
jgi:hypothetical protein